MKIICCAICGVERGPEVIEGCYANAKAQGLLGELVFGELLPDGAKQILNDYAHVWVEQPIVSTGNGAPRDKEVWGIAND